MFFKILSHGFCTSIAFSYEQRLLYPN
uniref:Uncharacterized protein n=1 Tax=Anguilla anguilla TaxID=7936 RepID=A0A0E9TZX7_ANGAN